MLAGKVFCISGEFDVSEDVDNAIKQKLRERIEKKGGVYVARFSTMATHVILGDSPSAKWTTELANNKNITGVSFEQFVAMTSVAKKTFGGPDSIVIPSPPPSPPRHRANLLLTDRNRPTKLVDIIGNKKLVHEVHAWLRKWRAGEGQNAIMLCGPAGIGKTSLAHVVAADCGYTVLELNASDVRGRQDVVTMLRGPSQTRVVGSTSRGNCIIMDEVDGMTGGEEGGAQALAQIIKSSQCPIICICNDKFAPPVKILKDLCVFFAVWPPNSAECLELARGINTRESLFISDVVLRDIVAQCNGDIRHIITTMQVAKCKGSTMVCETDRVCSPFDCARRMFASGVSLQEISSLAKDGGELMDAFVAENYIRATGAQFAGNVSAAGADAADLISLGDVMHETIWKSQGWALESIQQYVATVLPPTLTSGSLRGKVEFPSSVGKRKRFDLNDVLAKFQMGCLDVDMLITTLVVPLTTSRAENVVDDIIAEFRRRDINIREFDSLAEYGVVMDVKGRGKMYCNLLSKISEPVYARLQTALEPVS